MTCCFLRLLELLLQAATAKYQTSRLFVQKKDAFRARTRRAGARRALSVAGASLVGYERLLRFFRVICMAIAQVSVTPPARSAMPSAICGRGASPVAASAAAFAGACLESVVLGKGLGASGFDSGFGAGVSGSGAGAGVSGVGNRGGGSRRALRREEQRPGDDALLDRDRAGGRVVRVIGARGQCERLPVGRPAAHVDRVGQQVAFVRAQLVEVRICAVLLERGGQRGGRFRREACSRVLRHCAGYRGNGQPGQVRAQRIRARGHGAALVADDVLEDTAFDDASGWSRR